jgi:tryptophan 2,3-dioxygenase
MEISPPEGAYYGDYLQLKGLLSLQTPLSGTLRQGESHDETLFIVVHQIYELLFKQILHELDSFIGVFSRDHVAENDLGFLVARLERIAQLEGLFIPLLENMETMSPMDFLEFRNLLIPASGFQSVQFRAIEIKLGLAYKRREKELSPHVRRMLSGADCAYVEGLFTAPSALEVVERWLERLPFTQQEHFNFWQEYEAAVNGVLQEEKEIILASSHVAPEIKVQQLKQWEESTAVFASLFNQDTYAEIRASGQRTLSQKATLSALFILLYRHEGILQQPYRLLTALIAIDEKLTAWRYRHALMAHRLLGSKVGTGSSSGHGYLQNSTENSRIFTDLFNLSTFLLPFSRLPKLPMAVQKELNFYFKS